MFLIFFTFCYLCKLLWQVFVKDRNMSSSRDGKLNDQIYGVALAIITTIIQFSFLQYLFLLFPVRIVGDMVNTKQMIAILRGPHLEIVEHIWRGMNYRWIESSPIVTLVIHVNLIGGFRWIHLHVIAPSSLSTVGTVPSNGHEIFL